MAEHGVPRRKFLRSTPGTRTDLPPPRAVGVIGRRRGLLGTPLDGRFWPMDPAALAEAVDRLIGCANLTGVDYVVGFPEGGLVPAYAFAAACNLPVVLGSLHRFELPGRISFTEQHGSASKAVTISLHGLVADCRVIVVEDEVSTGNTIMSCVRALRAAGVYCDQVATIYAPDVSDLTARLAADGIELHVAHLFAKDVCEQLTAFDSSDARR